MDLPNRKSPRIPNYDYSLPNYYFVTICTHNKKCYFGTSSFLNEFGKIAEECILNISKRYPGVLVDKYVIMPNHIHVILIFDERKDHSNSANLSHVIG